MKIISRLTRGARYSEKYGNHPGTFFLILFIFMGGIVGLVSGGLSGLFFGAIFIFLFFIPIWLFGCWERGDL